MKEKFQFYAFDIEKSVHRSFSLFGIKFFSFFVKMDFIWIRIFGKGLVAKNTNTYKLNFSERNKYQKGFKIGKWYFRNLN
jgi:hypothetical protein